MAVWLTLLIIGTIIVSPFYKTDFTPALQQGLRDVTLIKFYGALMVVNGTLGLFYSFRMRSRHRNKILRINMLGSFVLLIFFTLLRLLTFGPTNIVWLSYALNCAVMGITYLRMKYEANSPWKS